MRLINLFVTHCSATPPQCDIGVAELRALHAGEFGVPVGGVWGEISRITGYTYTGRGWSDIGYHFVIGRDGRREVGRPLEIAGAHARGSNRNSIGICLIGGVNEHTGQPEANFAYAQYAELVTVLDELYDRWPGAGLDGHRDLSPDVDHDGIVTPDEWLKECPCFDVNWLYRGRAA